MPFEGGSNTEIKTEVEEEERKKERKKEKEKTRKSFPSDTTYMAT